MTQAQILFKPILTVLCTGCWTNSIEAIITVTVGIASAAVAAMFPVAGTIACWLCLQWPDQYHLPLRLLH